MEELSSSSLIGQELFSPEVMLAELLHFKAEVLPTYAPHHQDLLSQQTAAIFFPKLT